ncbi:hypothetical protein LSTR_LSTR014324, partial [Laodelphax striatellus]
MEAQEIYDCLMNTSDDDDILDSDLDPEFLPSGCDSDGNLSDNNVEPNEIESNDEIDDSNNGNANLDLLTWGNDDGVREDFIYDPSATSVGINPVRFMEHFFDMACVNSWLRYKGDCSTQNVPKKDMMDLHFFKMRLAQ